MVKEPAGWAMLTSGAVLIIMSIFIYTQFDIFASLYLIIAAGLLIVFGFALIVNPLQEPQKYGKGSYTKARSYASKQSERGRNKMQFEYKNPIATGFRLAFGAFLFKLALFMIAIMLVIVFMAIILRGLF